MRIRTIGFISCFLMLFSSALSGQLTADFRVNETNACGSLQVNFYDQSSLTSGNIVEWEWDLGGTFSAKQNPGIIFTEAGTYTICLKVTDNQGNTAEVCKDNLIEVYALPQPDFAIDITAGCSPISVNFTDLTTSENGGISEWIWDIGGSSNVITTKDPGKMISTIYENEGLYSMSLTVRDEKGCTNTIQKKDVVNVSQGPELDIDYEILQSCGYPWKIKFNNLSPDSEVTYFWDFGNGETFSGAFPPVIDYNEAGNFDVKIRLLNGSCDTEVILEDYIDTDRDNKIEVLSEMNCVGTRVSFTDASPVVADSILWNFGDGNYSDLTDPNHVYAQVGCYNVELYRYRDNCIDTVTMGECINILPSANVNYAIGNQYACSLPATVNLTGNGSGDFTWDVFGKADPETYTGDNVHVDIDAYGEYLMNITYEDITGCIYHYDSIELAVKEYEVNLPRSSFGGCAPMNVIMVDSLISEVPIDNYEWNVYDKTGSIVHQSTDVSPQFYFSDTGRYDVQLIVENAYGCMDTVYKVDYITTGMVPQVDFIASPLNSCIVEKKNFTDLSQSIVNYWFWNFGDGTFSYSQNPKKTYAKPGIYDVTLTALHNGCAASETKTKYISINQPRSTFGIVYDCENPYTVQINNTTTGADSLAWTIDLGGRDTVIFDSLLPPLTFPDRGLYAVTHYAYNASTACEHIRTDTVRITSPIADFTLDTMVGCAPLTIHVTNNSIDADTFLYSGDGAKFNKVAIPQPEIVYKSGGSYNGPGLVVTDLHGCKDTMEWPEQIIVNEIVAAADFDPVICIPGLLVPLSTSQSTFGNIQKYEWKLHGPQSDTLNVKEPIFSLDSVGVYDLILTITDDLNCKDEISYTEAIEALDLQPDFTIDSVSCTWAPVRLRAMNVSENIDSIIWDFGDGTFSDQKNPNHIYTQEGTYSVCLSLRDKRGCTSTICKDSIVTIKNPVADFTADITAADCPPLLSNFTSISQNANTYLWDFGDATGLSNNEHPGRVFTVPGVYDVSLEVSLTPQCSDTIIKQDYVVLEGPEGSFHQVSDSLCLPLTVTLIAESDDAYQYIWDYGNGEIHSLAELSERDTTHYVYDRIGSYVPKLIIDDGKGCNRAFAGERIIVNDLEPSFLMSDSIFCDAPASIEINNTSYSSSENVTYTWIVSGPQEVVSTSTSPTIKLDSTGLYNLKLISLSENCRDTLDIQDAIHVSRNPVALFEVDDQQLCESVKVAFDNRSSIAANDSIYYVWDFGDGIQSEEINPSHSYAEVEEHIVKLIAYTAQGCMDSTELMIPVLPSTVAQVSDPDTICIGDQLQLDGEIENLLDGGQFYWEDNTALSCTDCLDPIITPNQTDTYVLVGVHPNGCESRDSVKIEVVHEVGPDLTIVGDSMICLGNTAQFNILNYQTDFIYNWESAEGDSIICNDDCTIVTVRPESSSQYFVTVYNQYGCYQNDTIEVEVETTIGELLPEDRTICMGNSTILHSEYGNVMSWEMDGDIICNSDCQDLEVNPIARQGYRLTASSDLGCIYHDTIMVEVISPDHVQVTNDTTICVGETISLMGEGFGYPSWSRDSTLLDEGSDLLSISPINSGLYVYQSSKDECVIEDSVAVTVYSKASIAAIGDTICPGEDAMLLALPEISDVYWWEGIGEDIIVNNEEIMVSPDVTTTYNVISGFRICEEDTAQVTVVVQPKVETTIKKTFVKYSNTPLILEHTFADSNYTFFWSPDTALSCNNCPSPEIIDLNRNMKYNILITDSETGCELEKEVFVKYDPECNSNVLHIPNIFSPDQDGKNDGFRIYTKNENQFRNLQIFSRWGDQVFYSEDIEKEWEGNINQSRLLPGVYVYKVDMYCEDTGEIYSIMGDVTLIR